VRVVEIPRKTDVLVVGGGPAGLAAAIAARSQGLSVIVADGARPPVDKACGEGLMPDGVSVLERLGVALGDDDVFPFHGIRFIDGQLHAEAAFPDVPALGIRRTILHRRLLERALDAGAVACWGEPARFDRAGAVEVGGRRVRYRWLIGADGHKSEIRARMGLGPRRPPLRRIGIRQHFRVTPWTDFVEVYWANRCQASVTPVGASEVCVALIGDAPGRRLETISVSFPELAERLGDARPTTSVRGGVSATLRLRAVVGKRAALLGDASGSVDAITGEGLSIAFQQAIALGAALATDDLRSYQAAHRRIGRLPRMMARLLLLMSDWAWVRQRALAALRSRPEMFHRLLGIHVGALPPTALGASAIAGFAWQLVAADASDF
jgi:flavin-dependent dehydrogenase